MDDYEWQAGCDSNPQSAIINPQSFEEINCTLEGQIADVADRIAYNCHDLEDGLRARLIEGNQMRHVQIYVEATRKVGIERIPDWTIRRTRTAKTITDQLVSDCIDNSRRQIAEAGIRTARDACNRAENLVVLSPESDRLLAELQGVAASAGAACHADAVKISHVLEAMGIPLAFATRLLRC